MTDERNTPTLARHLWHIDQLDQWHKDPPPIDPSVTRVVILFSSFMNPIRLSVLQDLENVQQQLESRGYHVMATWLSPANDLRLKPKKQNPSFSAAFRCHLARLAILDKNKWFVGEWECSPHQPRPPSALQVCLSLQTAWAAAGLPPTRIIFVGRQPLPSLHWLESWPLPKRSSTEPIRAALKQSFPQAQTLLLQTMPAPCVYCLSSRTDETRFPKDFAQF